MKNADTDLSEANIKKLEKDLDPQKTDLDKADPPKDPQVANGEKPPKSEILEDDPNLKDRELDDLKKYEDDVDASTKKKMEEKADGDIEKGKNHKSKMKALVMARIITQTNDNLDTPVPVLLAELAPLKAMKGVEKFEAKRVQNGRFRIFMYGCINEISDSDGYDVKSDNDKEENEIDKDRSDSEFNEKNKLDKRKKLNDDINEALSSSDKDKRLEGKVADWLRDQIQSFNKKVHPHGELDVELDVELEDIIIEVTSKKSGKLPQIQKYLTNPSLNPSGKKVILFSENYNWRARADIIREGGFVASNKEELLQIIKQIRETK